MSLLLPEGIDHLGDCPFPLHQAILHGLRILGYEEWPREEQPPKEIWLDGEKLKEHWDRVERENKERYNPNREREDEGDYEENAMELITRG